MARAMIALFDGTGVELVVANAAGCGAAMKDYGHLLRDDVTWGKRAETFSARVRDVSQILADVAWKANLRNLALLERHAARAGVPPTRSDYVVVGIALGILALIALVPVLLLALVISYFPRLV